MPIASPNRFRPGAALLSMAFAIALTTIAPGASGPSGPQSSGAATAMQFAEDPVLVGAGDIADCGTTADSATAALLDAIEGTVFTAGDNAYPNGSAADFANCYEPAWGRHKSRTRPSPGNHDYISLAFPYFAYFGAHAGPWGRGYYSYDLGAWHVVSINSNIGAFAGSPQERWLRADLAANRTQCTLAYWHHPRFSSGLHGNQPQMRAIWQALYDFGADVIVAGHDHDYEQFARQDAGGVADPNGIKQFVVGTGGTGLRSFGVIQPNSVVRNSDAHGVLKLTLHPDSYDWEFVPVAGSTFTDTGSRPCVGSAPASPGGRGFALGHGPGGIEMTWTSGAAQTGYAVARIVDGITTLLPGAGVFLPADATEYADGGAEIGQFTCYALLPAEGAATIGVSDVLCTIAGSHSATGAPPNARVQLNQSTMATLTWSPPGGQTGYLVLTVPLNGGPQRSFPLPATATRAMHETNGTPTCYVVIATAGGTSTGNSDALCVLPGYGSLAFPGSR